MPERIQRYVPMGKVTITKGDETQTFELDPYANIDPESPINITHDDGNSSATIRLPEGLSVIARASGTNFTYGMGITITNGDWHITRLPDHGIVGTYDLEVGETFACHHNGGEYSVYVTHRNTDPQLSTT